MGSASCPRQLIQRLRMGGILLSEMPSQMSSERKSRKKKFFYQLQRKKRKTRNTRLFVSYHVLKFRKLWNSDRKWRLRHLGLWFSIMSMNSSEHAWCNVTRRKKKAFYQNWAASSFSLFRCFCCAAACRSRLRHTAPLKWRCKNSLSE